MPKIEWLGETKDGHLPAGLGRARWDDGPNGPKEFWGEMTETGGMGIS